jgi:tRNA 2-selenouridine synthase
MPPQPSTEHFENLIGDRLSQLDPERPVWIEAESRNVGSCRVTESLFVRMEAAPTLEVVRSLEERLDILVQVYGQTDRGELIEATQRIHKRLGGQRTQAAVELIQQEKPHDVCRMVLDYYDRTYRYDLERRNKTIPQIDMSGLSAEAAARRLIEKAPHLVGQLTPTAPIL